jgi:hypothetical protein
VAGGLGTVQVGTSMGQQEWGMKQGLAFRGTAVCGLSRWGIQACRRYHRHWCCLPDTYARRLCLAYNANSADMVASTLGEHSRWGEWRHSCTRRRSMSSSTWHRNHVLSPAAGTD